MKTKKRLNIAQQLESDFADAHHRAEETGSDKPIDDVRKQVEAAPSTSLRTGTGSSSSLTPAR
jgi:hypothetical protein